MPSVKKRHVYVRGSKIPVYYRRFYVLEGRAYKPTKKHKHLERKIEIRKSARPLAKLSTLIHEMLHQLDHRLAESTVLQLEAGLVEMVEENPEVFSDLSRLLESK